MAVIKCKMCGSPLTLIPGESVIKCEYCGTVQTVPSGDNEKKLVQFERANRLRVKCEFDKAAGIYESIVADFPEESEAYWGLVLCKYGIEYVDDPGTGKKIPTCHRSSFESVLEDDNYEQALENADVVARRVYRDEAKTIEELRKGILEVSAQEAPYDIFICYKETDFNKERTIDSELAETIYNELTDRGYRVFFSRISLEDKLGMAYEPYIFAALNSAKVMLAVGTDYEFYNAVWVKNEWSRFLQLIAKGAKKYLIACYKKMDPEDLPREFAKLQAQDMGKVGAMQDLMRGIEKIIPRKKADPTPVTGNNVKALLERGKMALEEFFEQALNQDARCTGAYIGKALAGEQCASLTALAEKRLASRESASYRYPKIEKMDAYIRQKVRENRVPGWLEGAEAEAVYEYDLSYRTCAEDRRAQLDAEKQWWKEHKQLSRAQQFAVGEDQVQFESALKKVFDTMEERIEAAQSEEVHNAKRREERYAAFLKEADVKLSDLRSKAEADREKCYISICDKLENRRLDVTDLEVIRKDLVRMDGYKNSRALIQECDKRITELEAAAKKAAEEKAAREREKYLREREEAERQERARRRNKIITSTIFVLVVLAVGAWFFVQKTIIEPQQLRDEARALADAGDYEAAIALLESAEEDASYVKYMKAEVLEESGNIGGAAAAFGAIYDYKDAGERSDKLWEQIHFYRETVVLDGFGAIAIKNNGTVVAASEYNRTIIGTEEWKDIIAVDLGVCHAIGLKADGTVVCACQDTRECGDCDTSDWKNIIDIAATQWAVFGLRKDGTVAHTGISWDNGSGVAGWTDIVDIAAGSGGIVGLKADGTIVTCGGNSAEKYEGMKNIVSIDMCGGSIVAKTKDGVIHLQLDSNYTFYEWEWENIERYIAGGQHLMALRTDGTVQWTGRNNNGECNVDEWTDIAGLATGSYGTIGVHADGTIEYAGCFCEDIIRSWSDIRVPR